MEILGVGPSEFVFIVLIAIIVLGPKNMKQAGRTIGHFLNRYVTSDVGKLVTNTFTEITNLPRRLMREANLENWEKDLSLQNTIAPPERKPLTSSFKAPQTKKAGVPNKPLRKNTVATKTPEKEEKPTSKKKDD